MADRLMRRPEVENMTGLSRSTIYAWMGAGRFPKPVPLGSRLVAWRESDVLSWIEARPSAEAEDIETVAALAAEAQE